MSTTWQCPKCGARVTVYTTVACAPTCAHNGRASKNNPSTTMKEVSKP